MPAEDAHRDAFWVITVVGGMSVAKAIEQFITGVSLSHWSLGVGVVILRMIVFLVIAVRFFIGASVFFQQVHIEAGHDLKFPNRNYVIDFSSAIAHFSILYWLALGIGTEPSSPVVLEHEQFSLALCMVLLYDWVWYALSAASSCTKIIRSWATRNTLTLIPCVIAFILFFLGYIDRGWFEILQAFSILLFSFPDMVGMAKGTLPG
jgi:hypothetical protein